MARIKLVIHPAEEERCVGEICIFRFMYAEVSCDVPQEGRLMVLTPFGHTLRVVCIEQHVPHQSAVEMIAHFTTPRSVIEDIMEKDKDGVWQQALYSPIPAQTFEPLP